MCREPSWRALRHRSCYSPYSDVLGDNALLDIHSMVHALQVKQSVNDNRRRMDTPWN